MVVNLNKFKRDLDVMRWPTDWTTTDFPSKESAMMNLFFGKIPILSVTGSVEKGEMLLAYRVARLSAFISNIEFDLILKSMVFAQYWPLRAAFLSILCQYSFAENGFEGFQQLLLNLFSNDEISISFRGRDEEEYHRQRERTAIGERMLVGILEDISEIDLDTDLRVALNIFGKLLEWTNQKYFDCTEDFKMLQSIDRPHQEGIRYHSVINTDMCVLKLCLKCV